MAACNAGCTLFNIFRLFLNCMNTTTITSNKTFNPQPSKQNKFMQFFRKQVHAAKLTALGAIALLAVSNTSLAQTKDAPLIVGDKQFDVSLRRNILTLKFSAKDSSLFDVGGDLSCVLDKQIRIIQYFKSPDGNGANIVFGNAILMVKPSGLEGADHVSVCSNDSSAITKLIKTESGALIALTPTTFMISSPASAFTFKFTEKVFGKSPYHVYISEENDSCVLITSMNSSNKIVRMRLGTKTYKMETLVEMPPSKATLKSSQNNIKIVGEKQFDVAFDPVTMTLTLNFSAKDSSVFDVTKNISWVANKKLKEIWFFKSPDGNGANLIFDKAILQVIPVGLEGADISGVCAEDSSKITKLFLAKDASLIAITPTTFLVNSPTGGFTFLFTEKVFGKGPYKVDISQEDDTHVQITSVNSANKTVKIRLDTKSYQMERLH